MYQQERRLTLDNIDKSDCGLVHIILLNVVAAGALVRSLGTVLSSHAGLGHDEDIGHVGAGDVGGLVNDFVHDVFLVRFDIGEWEGSLGTKRGW